MAFEDMINIKGDSVGKANPLGNNDKLNASDYKDQPKGGKTWKLLKSKHECYNERALRTKKEDYLYHGGFEMNTVEVASLFCIRMKNEESQKDFSDRIASAAYTPTFSKLITGLISNLYSQDLAVMEAADHDDPTTAGQDFTENLRDFYKLFHNDCDGHGMPMHDFMRHVTTKTLIHGFNYFGLDYPKGEATNLLEQEQLGLDKPRMYKIDSESVYDWKIQDDAHIDFEWIKLLDCRKYQPTAFDPPMRKYYIKNWFMDEEGYAAYECYESDAYPMDKEPQDKDILRKVDEGVTSFNRIPIFYFKIDAGIAVGAKLAPMAAELFNRTTLENHATDRACITVPTLYKGNMFPGGDALPDPIMSQGSRGYNPRGKVNNKGIYELGDYTTERFEIVEADGKALAFIHKQNEDLDEKMHSVIHQMGQSMKQTRNKSAKSGLAKQEDRRATEMLLTAIADEVYAIVEKVFKTISDSRNEDIIWEIKGLSSQSSDNREELVLEAALLDKLHIPSSTFRKEYFYRVGSRLVEGTDQRTLQTIRREIEEGLDELGDKARAPMTTEIMDAQSEVTSQVPGKSTTNPTTPKTDTVSPNPMTVGKTGQGLMPEGSHLQTGQHVDGQLVYDQLKDDYNEKDIQFVLHITWIGPVEVPLSSIDFSNKDNWQASQDEEHVQEFADKMKNDNFSKPIILVNNPSNDNKMMIVDGHHRALAALENNEPVNAYIGQVGSTNGPWDKLHSKQGSNQKSIQKAVVKEVKKSEKAVK